MNVDQLERAINALEKIGAAQERRAQGEADEKRSSDQFSSDDLEERARIKLKNSLDLALEYHRETNTYGQTSIRMSLIFNGTGILVVMNFVSNAVRTSVPLSADVLDGLSTSLIFYVCGAALAIVGSVFGYFGNLHGTHVRAFEPILPILKRAPNGFREITAPRSKAYRSKPVDYVASHHQAATGFQSGVVLAMVVAYALFGIGTLFSHDALMTALQNIGAVSPITGPQ